MEKNFIFFEKYFSLAENLTNEQFGRVMKELGRSLKQNREPETENFSKEEVMFCEMVYYEILKNLEKYYVACEKNKNNKKNKNKKNNKNNNNHIACAYDFDEIERLEIERRMKNADVGVIKIN